MLNKNCPGNESLTIALTVSFRVCFYPFQYANNAGKQIYRYLERLSDITVTG